MIDYQYFEGGLVGDPEVRFTPNGKAVTNFTLAQSDSKKNDAGDWETTTQRYLRVNMWDTDRHTWSDALTGISKGTKLVVRGKLVTEKWQDKEGNNRSQLGVQAVHAYIDATANTGAQQQPSGWQVQDNKGGFGQNTNDEQPPF